MKLTHNERGYNFFIGKSRRDGRKIYEIRKDNEPYPTQEVGYGSAIFILNVKGFCLNYHKGETREQFVKKYFGKKAELLNPIENKFLY